MEADRIRSFFAQDLAKALWDANWAQADDDTPTLGLDATEIELAEIAPRLVGAQGGHR